MNMGVSTAIGIAIGAAIGSATGDMGRWVAMGAGLGLVFGAIASRRGGGKST